MDISASLVLYKNHEEQVKKILSCIIQSTEKIDLYCVDNSPNNALESTCRNYNAHYKNIPTNPGFGAAHNHALFSTKKSSIHIIINPDIYFDPNCIAELIKPLIENKYVVATSPKVLYPDHSLQRLCKLLPTPTNLLLRRFIPSLAKISDRRYELHDFNYSTPIEIPYASGCFIAVRTDVLRKIGGFDVNFFMYLEDTDLSRRLLDHGKILFTPNAIAFHEFSKASYRNKKLLIAHIKSAIYYFNKWGWFFDKNRRIINKKTLMQVQELKTRHKDDLQKAASK